MLLTHLMPGEKRVSSGSSMPRLKVMSPQHLLCDCLYLDCPGKWPLTVCYSCYIYYAKYSRLFNLGEMRCFNQI